MKLTLNLHSLMYAVEIMEPEKRGVFQWEHQITEKSKIDVELAYGKDVELKDVDIDSGLLSYKGRQVLLYIKDHGNAVQSVINNPSMGNKYHVADCSKLKSMRSEGRFERYVVINDTSGEFPISGSHSYGQGREDGYARLNVCKLCLGQLNYKGYGSGGSRSNIFDKFNMAEFFSTYSSFFPYMPSRRGETAESGYTADWSKISSHYRVEKNFECEECQVDMRSNRSLLHVHHVNGVKSDNRSSNLRALCVDCHSKQPMHQHMALSHRERQTINCLRKEQGLLDDLVDWEKLFNLSDPGVHGVLHACRQAYLRLPEINYVVENGTDDLAAHLELAWPKHKFGIAISENDLDIANRHGWHAVGVNEFLENYKTQAYNLRY